LGGDPAAAPGRADADRADRPVLGISRNTVKAALACDGPPKYRRALAGSVADAFEPRIRELLQAFPQMPSTVIAGRIGWPYSIRTLSGKVAELRPLYLPPDLASQPGTQQAT